MSSNEKTDPSADAAAALRSAAADLIAKADLIERTASEAKAPAEERPEPVAPLAPAADEDEANARLVALDLSTRGTGRGEAERLLSDQFPGVDLVPLLDRFFPG